MILTEERTFMPLLMDIEIGEAAWWGWWFDNI